MQRKPIILKIFSKYFCCDFILILNPYKVIFKSYRFNLYIKQFLTRKTPWNLFY